jgi:hypothetical protein
MEFPAGLAAEKRVAQMCVIMQPSIDTCPAESIGSTRIQRHGVR